MSEATRSSLKYTAANGAATATRLATASPWMIRIDQAASRCSRFRSLRCTHAFSSPNASHASTKPMTSIAMATRPKSAGVRMRAMIATLTSPSRRATQRNATTQIEPRTTLLRSVTSDPALSLGSCALPRRRR